MLLDDFLKKNFSINNFLFLCTISLFTFQLKINSALLIFPLIIYLINIRKQKFLKTQISYFLILVFTTIIYFLKNLIISGCIIFPISHTCIDNLSWTNTKNVQNFSERVMGENNAFRFSQNFVSWF